MSGGSRLTTYDSEVTVKSGPNGCSDTAAPPTTGRRSQHQHPAARPGPGRRPRPARCARPDHDHVRHVPICLADPTRRRCPCAAGRSASAECHVACGIAQRWTSVAPWLFALLRPAGRARSPRAPAPCAPARAAMRATTRSSRGSRRARAPTRRSSSARPTPAASRCPSPRCSPTPATRPPRSRPPPNVHLEQVDGKQTVTRIELCHHGRRAGHRRGGVHQERRGRQGELPDLAAALAGHRGHRRQREVGLTRVSARFRSSDKEGHRLLRRCPSLSVRPLWMAVAGA